MNFSFGDLKLESVQNLVNLALLNDKFCDGICRHIKKILVVLVDHKTTAEVSNQRDHDFSEVVLHGKEQSRSTCYVLVVDVASKYDQQLTNTEQVSACCYVESGLAHRVLLELHELVPFEDISNLFDSV